MANIKQKQSQLTVEMNSRDLINIDDFLIIFSPFNKQLEPFDNKKFITHCHGYKIRKCHQVDKLIQMLNHIDLL